ncbi:GMP synthase (glutamine-hydrolyzing) [Marinitoga hydrogenitolerans DSM 16785]|uniref:GMP synthase [glutamine-hydrolyzing] n=1 Tax=Marinitoga hydrogenitolerans (strain DSM 16785 / JCM 12826 / AT1271) TaxID=1122195 RepID=A0A1M4U6A2_MARH1|nr:glutamine-hydrolyzing GMP synthase [Marinitoga hydrogenitolerans]SHE52225.1 GMP synthase (glutamine-hydrolyzing) [Marinitoga hydrogenitolerans DSM 16785]
MKKVIIIDYGSQYTQLLARRVRELGVYSEVIQYDDTPSNNFGAIILSGGPKSVNEQDSLPLPKWVLESNKPILGICYGLQLLAKNLGGKVKRTEVAEYGKTEVEIIQDPIFYNIPKHIITWMSHGDSVTKLPQKYNVIAKTKNNIYAAIKFSNNIYGLQFHPEVKHTDHGEKIIKNFLFYIAKLEKNWSLNNFIDEKINEIKNEIKDKKAIIALSGGVDSSVATVLVHKAIGKNLKAVFVNHGLLRLNEENEVKKIFKDLIGINLNIVDSKKRFLNRLKNIYDPEQKRKIIGEEFIRVFEDDAKGHYDYLVQGTIYSDIIESAASGKNTAKIKSHHNVGGLPENINLKIIEPLKFLFKDEVRKIGEILGIPKHILYRHPFPGPGLAIRIIGEITEEKLNILRRADQIFIETLKEYNWYNKVWQAFTVLTSIKTVGVVGDERNYDYVLAIRSVDSVEGMTANWSKIPFDILEKVSNRITNEIKGVGRVVYDITSKPPATIEWE